MDSDSELPFADTLTPVSQEIIAKTEDQVCSRVWGRLFPRLVYLKPIDLMKNIYLFGRGTLCDIQFSPTNFQKSSLSFISKVHFKITCDDDDNIVYIEDCSKNGTFINNIQIGKHRVKLHNDDEISVGVAKLSVYIFKKFNLEDSYLPLELKRKYEISRLLGQGAFGEVKLAFSKVTAQQFAIKRVSKDRTSYKNLCHPNSTIEILNEVNILKSLAHPCIIQMHDVLETHTAVFIVLEYMEGGELTKHIEAPIVPLTESRAKLIFYQTVLGVQYLHEHGIVHRDLKPGNILLKTNDTETIVKVSDFGLSKIVHDNVFMATVCGTPMFAAPEVIDVKRATYDQKIDIWSLGVILFYMLSKELPFKAQVRAELFHKILNSEYEMNESKWKDISENAKCIVRRMLVKNPQERIKIDGVAKHPWLQEDEYVCETVANLLKDASIGPPRVFFNHLRNQHMDATLPISYMIDPFNVP